MNDISVIDWISGDDAQEKEVSIGGMGGWAQNGARWNDLISGISSEQKPYYEALRASILQEHIRVAGDTHQNEYVPLVSDGTVGSFSFRAWGDLMACIWATEDNTDYNYMDFYMDSWMVK